MSEKMGSFKVDAYLMNVVKVHRLNFFLLGGVASGPLPSVLLVLNLFNSWP